MDTVNKIERAFTKLLQHNYFRDINVTQICNEANIYRGTFYLHYSDKYTLLDTMITKNFKNFNEMRHQLESDMPTGIVPSENIDLFLSTICDCFQTILDNKFFFRPLIMSEDISYVEIKLVMIIRKTITTNLKLLEKNKAINLKHNPYLIDFISSAIVGVIKSWFVNNNKESPHELAGYVAELMIPITKEIVRKNRIDK